MNGVAGKVVATTGASNGIGAATARNLAASGAAVVAGARRRERLDGLVAELRGAGARAFAVQTDLTRAGDLVALVETATEQFGRLDVLVSNAGLARIAPVSALDVDAWTMSRAPGYYRVDLGTENRA